VTTTIGVSLPLGVSLASSVAVSLFTTPLVMAAFQVTLLGTNGTTAGSGTLTLVLQQTAATGVATTALTFNSPANSQYLPLIFFGLG
jgi:hypothetical protein